MSSHLQHSDEASGSGVKIIIKCNEITDEHPTTKDWLNSIEGLDLINSTKAIKMPNKKILQGIINKKHKVVLKIANSSEDLEKEWEIYKELHNNKIPNLTKYFCYFKCADIIEKYVNPSNSICNGKGETMQVLVMEYLPAQSFKNFDWTTVPIESLRSCILQAILFCLYSFEKLGFIHGDYHLDNLLICKTQKKQISYSNITVGLHGLQIKCIDFELSKIGSTDIKLYFRNIYTFINKLLSLSYFIDGKPILNINDSLRKWIESDEKDPRKVLEFIPIVEKINFVKNVRFGSGGAQLFNNGKKRPIMFGRKVV